MKAANEEYRCKHYIESSLNVTPLSLPEFVSVSPAVTLLKGQKETLSCTIPNAPYSVKVNWFRSSDDVMVKEYTSDHANAEYTSTHEVRELEISVSLSFRGCCFSSANYPKF